jgi:hypothetical protein
MSKRWKEKTSQSSNGLVTKQSMLMKFVSVGFVAKHEIDDNCRFTIELLIRIKETELNRIVRQIHER